METKHRSIPQKVDAARLAWIMERGSRFVMQKPEIIGLENLADIPEGAVLATSHLSDADIPAIVAALSPHRDIDIASLSTNQTDPKQRFFIRVAGRKHFHDVTNTLKPGSQDVGTQFRAEDYVDMQEAIAQGRDMAIATYEPVRNGMHPSQGGFGAVFLAHLANVPIIPISLAMETEGTVGLSDDLVGTVRRWIRGKQPAAKITIGAPIYLDSINRQDLEDIGRLLGTADSRYTFREEMEAAGTMERYERTRRKLHPLHSLLKAESVLVMQALAAMLPKSKGGTLEDQVPQVSE